MERAFIFGDYNTWTDWQLILTEKSIPDPEPRTNYVEIPGMSGSLDLSEALSGEPIYNDRVISATFCATEGTHWERERLLHKISAAVHGRRVKIVEPDDPEHFFVGRVKITDKTVTETYAVFSVAATCEPWRYAMQESLLTFPVASTSAVPLEIYITGTKTMCPEITIAGEVTLSCNGITSTGTSGKYKILTFKLYPGRNVIWVSGNGTLILTYREAEF